MGHPCRRGDHKVWAVLLLVFAPLSEGRYDQDRRLQADRTALPDGLRLKETLVSDLPLSVYPSWDLFLGFSDRRKVIMGKMTLLMIYTADALRFVSNPQDLISIDNFGDGTRYLQGTVSIIDSSGADAFATSNIYVGDFSQQQSGFNHLCYPFDDKTVKFDISIQKPGNFIFNLLLLCPSGLGVEAETATAPNNKTVVTKCTYPVQGSLLGFDWGNFVCEASDDQMIQCWMTGVRQWTSIFQGYLWPSITFSIMGFGSFGLSVKLAMPRVATTMLALVSLTNLRNSVMDLLPGSGETSWLEEYFLIATNFMLLNLLGHLISFWLDSLGKTNLQKMMNKFSSLGMIAISVTASIARLHERNCPLVDRTLSTFLVVFCTLMTILTFLSIAWAYKESMREAATLVKQTSGLSARVVPDYKDGADGDD